MLFYCVLEKTLENPLECKEIKPIHPKGNKPWIVIGRTATKAETPILWPPDEKSRLIGKDPDAGKDWRQEEKGTTEDEMVGWHHRLDGHEFQQAPGDGEGQGSLWSMGSRWVRHDWATELNWRTLLPSYPTPLPDEKCWYGWKTSRWSIFCVGWIL